MLRGKISQYSQSGVLKNRMEKAGFTHGREARVNLRGINVQPTAEEESVIYFCNTGPIDVVESVQEGDGAPLPEEVEVEDLCFTEHGFYDLQGVILSSNGVLKVKADERTRAERRSRLPVYPLQLYPLHPLPSLEWARNAWQAISAFFTGR